MRIVCLSDTHLRHRSYLIKVPECDLLIHSGDALVAGDKEELHAFLDWFSELPAKHKVYVAGNHDVLFEKDPVHARALIPEGVVYLQDSEVEIEGLRIWGSPWQPEFQNWAFNLPRGDALRTKWSQVPNDLDILVTHSPPYGILDINAFGDPVGCEELRAAINLRPPRLHVFGHVHGSYGLKQVGPTLHVNASICDEAYRAVHSPVVLEMTKNSLKDVSEDRLYRPIQASPLW
jgi:Icc-related predicted phosphoesterase